MIPSLYVIGGAGTGKSTFTQQLLDHCSFMGPLLDLHQTPNARGTIITLRGHELIYPAGVGIYVGCMRDSFPGTDGLDRASSIAGEGWLQASGHQDYGFVLAEGATLATRRFLGSLQEDSDLLLLHLHADDFVKELRFQERGSSQAEQFVRQTTTRSANLLADMEKLGASTLSIDTSDPEQWQGAIEESLKHLGILQRKF